MRTPLALLLLLIPSLVSAQAPALRLAAPAGSLEVLETAVTLDSPPEGPTEWFAKPDQKWITVEPRTGVTPTRVTIRINPSGLPNGLQRGVLRFVDDAGDDMLVVPVTLAMGQAQGPVEAADVAETPASRATTAPKSPAAAKSPGAQAAAPTAEVPLSITVDALPPVTRNLPYSQAIPVKGGKPPYSFRVKQGRLPLGLTMVNGALTGLTRFPGVYPLEVTVTDSSTPAQSVTKVLDLRVIVILQGTALTVTPPTLAIGAQAGRQAPGVRVGIASGAQPLAWTATSDQPWLLLSPPSGVAPSVLLVVADATRLERGGYVATVTVTMEGAPNSPMRVPIQVVVR